MERSLGLKGAVVYGQFDPTLPPQIIPDDAYVLAANRIRDESCSQFFLSKPTQN
jgi:hypothetical protein